MHADVTVLVLKEKGIQDFAAARNNLLANVQTEWALFLDSDEQITPELECEIDQVLSSSEAIRFAGFTLKRLDRFMNAELHFCENGNLRFLRLARTKSGKWVRPIHEYWQITGRVGKLHNPLIHSPHSDLSTFISKIDSYSSIDAEFRYQSGARSSLGHLFVYPVAKFFRNYFWLQGYRDGIPGIVMAIMMSFHSYLTWTKLYILQKERTR